MACTVEVMRPNEATGVALELPPQLRLPGVANSTWLGALNISMRNSRFLFSAMGKNLKTETSSFPTHGPLRLLRPQFPKVATRGLENAAGFHQPFWLLLGRTGLTPALQLRRLAVVMKLVPP